MMYSDKSYVFSYDYDLALQKLYRYAKIYRTPETGNCIQYGTDATFWIPPAISISTRCFYVSADISVGIEIHNIIEREDKKVLRRQKRLSISGDAFYDAFNRCSSKQKEDINIRKYSQIYKTYS